MATEPHESAPKKGNATLNRCRTIAACLGALALALPRDGLAQTYPDRTISYVVPSSPGSSPDIVGRIVAEALSKILGQPVVVLNRAGAGGTIAAAAVARVTPDGYTVLQANANHSFSQTLYKNLSYDLEKDFTPVGRFASAFYIFLAHPKVGIRSLKELIEKAKAHPGKLNYASGGIGAATFIVTEVLKAQAQLDIVHVPYNGGGPALASILAGVTDIYGSPYTTAKPFVDDGKLVGLAVTSAQRVPYLPEMPTVAETIPGYEVATWHGLVLPAGTPVAVRDKLQSAITQVVNAPETKKRLEELGYVVMTDTPRQFADFLHEDVKSMAKLINEYNLKPE
jgi:tripartite-type tricarboxylate transporter receptor subunit TctC